MKDLEKIITKELLRRVLPKETQNLSYNFSFTINEDYIEFSDNGEMQFEYCIYKFAFLCKEWALTKGYKIQSQLNSENKGHVHISKIADKELANGFFENTELEAVFKACEYILKELNEMQNL